MALPNPYPAMKKASQQGLYPGSGVAQGGNVSRPPTMHMGSPSSAAGGVNAKGSMFKAAPLPRIAARSGSVGRPATTKPNTPTPIGGRPVAHPTVSTTPTVSKVSIVGPPPTPGALGALSTSDPAYLSAIAQADLNYNNAGGAITDLKGQLATNAPLYALNVYDTNHASITAADQLQSQLAARGAFSSGSNDQADVERKGALDKAMQSLSEQYGPAAAAAIQGKIDVAEATRLNQRQADYDAAAQTAYQTALSNTQSNPPSNPIADPAAAAATAAAAASTPPQAPGVQKYAPKGWAAGKSGWFQQNGAWHFINAGGTIAHNVAAPTGSNATRVFK